MARKELAKKTQKISYSSPGAGNPLHLAAELFNARTGVKLMHVPYKGVAPAMNAAMSGEVQVIFIPATIALAHVKSGRLKGLAFTGASRFAMDELQLPVRDVMTKAHIGHLPILEGNKLFAIISFHDVARASLKEAKFENSLLKRYIKHWPE